MAHNMILSETEKKNIEDVLCYILYKALKISTLQLDIPQNIQEIKDNNIKTPCIAYIKRSSLVLSTIRRSLQYPRQHIYNFFFKNITSFAEKSIKQYTPILSNKTYTGLFTICKSNGQTIENLRKMHILSHMLFSNIPIIIQENLINICHYYNHNQKKFQNSSDIILCNILAEIGAFNTLQPDIIIKPEDPTPADTIPNFRWYKKFQTPLSSTVQLHHNAQNISILINLLSMTTKSLSMYITSDTTSKISQELSKCLNPKDLGKNLVRILYQKNRSTAYPVYFLESSHSELLNHLRIYYQCFFNRQNLKYNDSTHAIGIKTSITHEEIIYKLAFIALGNTCNGMIDKSMRISLKKIGIDEELGHLILQNTFYKQILDLTNHNSMISSLHLPLHPKSDMNILDNRSTLLPLIEETEADISLYSGIQCSSQNDEREEHYFR